MSIELLINQDIKIVLLLFDIDWYINALPSHCEWNWLGVVLIFKKDGKLLKATGQLVWDKCKLNFRLGISFDFSRSLELNLGKEFFIFNLLLSKSSNFCIMIF